MSEMIVCPLCGKAAQKTYSGHGYYGVNCKACYNFCVYESVDCSNGDSKLIRKRYNAIYEYLLHNGQYANGSTRYFRKFWCRQPSEPESTDVTMVDVNAIMKNYPKNVGEKLDRILINLSSAFPDIGMTINVLELPHSLLFLESENTDEEQLAFWRFLSDLGYYVQNSQTLTAKAWARIDELTSKQHEINQGFIAMSFRGETKTISESFKTAIEACGYAAKRIDEKEHNNQIVPEIFFEIAQSKFVVVDVTFPNYGAYYEAGYAQALGKQVIICCEKSVFESDKRPHFDISQKSMIVWENAADLIERLEKRIAATVGRNL